MRRAAILVCAVVLAVLSGCASPGRVALLDGEAGAKVGAVAVMDPKTEAERGQLTAANTETPLAGAMRPRPMKGNFDALLSVMPPPAQVFTLYFVEGTTQLAPESEATFAALRQAVTPTSDVQITGHTDTTGDPAANDKLSLDRAIQVRAALAQEGLPVANARVTGRGSRELKVQTGPGVSEPANRRVEVIVR